MGYTFNFILTILIAITAGCGNKDSGNKNNVSFNKVKGVRTEIFVSGLVVPWSMVFTSPERMLVNERPGRLRVIENGKLLETPLRTFDDVSSNSEEGLMGLALDPAYSNNKFIYISYAYINDGELTDKVVRFTDKGTALSDEMLIFNSIPAARFHAGCRIKFGPDSKLYITTGDAGKKELAQDLNKLNGKILRINSDGSIPSDNPFPNSPVWSYGHRNPQGIDWVPGSEIMWETEHGPSGFDGPGGGDEVNVIEKGKNYGWPEVSHLESKVGMKSPLLVFTPAIAPASGLMYKSGKIERFKDCFLFGCLKGEGIMVIKLDPNDKTKYISYEKIETDYGRIREITEGPDGSIYFSSSNRDGRGRVQGGDDKIYIILNE
ncbi:MAG: PQQ-dependent sugar dehydrogenase [Ignavibacteria bacterium]|nr:PQQ-dependent sugar dehydrogenase [Ignavibacteria bacterium]